MKALHEVLRSHRREIVRDWAVRIRGTIVPGALARPELEDHIPVYLEQLARTLETAFGRVSEPDIPETCPPALEHGVHRLRLGFDARALVAEYGALWEAIQAVAQAEGVEIDARTSAAVVRFIVLGIGDAVGEYARQRDLEMQRHANEHFAFIAHELRNPLSSALTAHRLLPPAADERAARSLGVIERSLTRMRDLIGHQLEVAQRAATIELRPEAVSIGGLLDELVGESVAEAETRGVQLHTEFEAGLELSADLRLLRSALGNLIRNAVKFSQPGCPVSVRAKMDSGKVRIEVEDGCGGLPPGKVEAAFTPFVQLGEDRSGFGLGLSIAKHAAEAHGGRIQVQDLPGKGCIFALELPPIPSSTPA